VTGSNGGLGLEAARHFARLGASRLILACRSTERGEAAKADIERSLAATSTSASTIVEVWPLDLCSFESVRAFCRRAEAELERLDVLLANAAILTLNCRMAEGYEMQVTTNVISTFLLVLMLLPVMRRTAARYNVEPAVTVVASEAHLFVSYPCSHLFSSALAHVIVSGRRDLSSRTSQTYSSLFVRVAPCTTAMVPPNCSTS
jgi:NAD(P)-dependent dehydrogenase (short-subunit alcohol dehydrogenase family)